MGKLRRSTTNCKNLQKKRKREIETTFFWWLVRNQWGGVVEETLEPSIAWTVQLIHTQARTFIVLNKMSD